VFSDPSAARTFPSDVGLRARRTKVIRCNCGGSFVIINDNANDAAGNHLRRLPLVLKLLHLSYENAKMKPCAMCVDVVCCMYVCMLYNAVLSVHV
jgi:hypothetical protein